MFLAQHMPGGGGLYSPWMGRQGDNIIVTIERIASDFQLSVEVFHKNSDETGNGTKLGLTALDASSNGVFSKEFNDVKELVRYKYVPRSSDSRDLAFFRMLEPVWFDEVKA